jgi:hypothetical protein
VAVERSALETKRIAIEELNRQKRELMESREARVLAAALVDHISKLSKAGAYRALQQVGVNVQSQSTFTRSFVDPQATVARSVRDPSHLLGIAKLLGMQSESTALRITQIESSDQKLVAARPIAPVKCLSRTFS